MHDGIAALWGMRALVRKDTVAAGQISEPAVTDQRDLGNIHLLGGQCSSYLSVSLGSTRPSMVVGKPLYIV